MGRRTLIVVVIDDRGAIREADVEADDALRFVARLLGDGSRPTIVGAFAHNRVLLLADKTAMAAADARKLVPAAALPRAFPPTYGMVVAVAFAAPFEPSAAPYAVQNMRLAMYCDLLAGRLRTLDPKPKATSKATSKAKTSTSAEDKTEIKRCDADEPIHGTKAAGKHARELSTHQTTKVPVPVRATSAVSALSAAPSAKPKPKPEVTRKHDADESDDEPRRASIKVKEQSPALAIATAVPTAKPKPKPKPNPEVTRKHDADESDDEPRRASVGVKEHNSRPPTRAAATAAAKIIRDAASDPAKLRAALGGGDDGYVSAEDSDFSLPNTSDTVPTSESESESGESD